jgi:hypothetical protein
MDHALDHGYHELGHAHDQAHQAIYCRRRWTWQPDHTLMVGPDRSWPASWQRAEPPDIHDWEGTMNWYNYVACFFAGALLANVVPHFVHGISGDRFPTPFAKPPGWGLSSPTVNVVWAWINLVIGYVLFRAGRVSSENYATLIVLLAGIVFISTVLSFRFRQKMREQ